MASDVKTYVNTNEYIITHIKNAILGLQNPGVSASAYDTAWIARISHDGKTPVFPETLHWVLKNQLPDGSWGAHVEQYHDRIISTLSCIRALKQYNFDRRYRGCIEKGEAYICAHVDDVYKDHAVTVGFELLFPKLMYDAWGENMCLSCMYTPVADYERLRKRKLQLLEKYVYSKPTTLLHSLEFFGEQLDFEKIMPFQAKNGSFLNSPSATAFVYMYTKNARALQYIKNVVKVCDGVAPVNYPLDIFRTNWILGDIYDAGVEDIFSNEIVSLTNDIERNWTEKGLSWSQYFDLPDLDNTAVGYRNLMRAGRKMDEKVFTHFYNGASFFCFEGETAVGPSHIANFLKTLNEMKKTPFVARAQAMCVQKLIETKNADWSWNDKWHVSRLYVTSRVFMAMKHNPLWRQNIQAYFRAIGSMIRLTHEEMYYTKLVLGTEYYINDRYPMRQNREMWIDKVLYGVEV